MNNSHFLANVNLFAFSLILLSDLFPLSFKQLQFLDVKFL